MAAADPSNNPGVKVLVETSDLKSIPSEFIFQNDSKGSHSDSIPTVDFSDLTSDDPHRRSQALAELARACQEWGFFVLINHGVPERLMKGIIDASLEFFELPEEEKSRYASKSASDPIKAGSGTVFTTSDQKIHLWRDFVKSYVHPEFHCPDKPQSLRETVGDYTERTRSILRTLMKAISENLGLEEGYTDEALKLDSCFQQYTANYYPPCPHPDQAIGLPPHTDHGLLTFLIHNGVAGLHIQHGGVWFDVDSPQNSILVNTGDHLQIFSNGRYNSVKHRAVVNPQAARISIVMANGAAPDAIVGPAAPLVERDGRAKYRPMKFIEYVETMLSNRVDGKGNLGCLKIPEE